MDLIVLQQMVDEFQCPGCVCGANTKTCPSFKLEYDKVNGSRCVNHVAGTLIGGIGHINLGLPKGFNRVVKPRADKFVKIRLHFSAESFRSDKFNVAVWAMEKDGYLFVRTFSPRVDATYVDVVKGGTLELVPEAINVGEFIDGID